MAGTGQFHPGNRERACYRNGGMWLATQHTVYTTTQATVAALPACLSLTCLPPAFQASQAI